MNQNWITLDYHIIKEQLQDYVASGLGRKMVEDMEPLTDPALIELRLEETSEARKLLDGGGSIPLRGLHDITEQVDRAAKGSILETAELIMAEDFLRGCRELKKYLKQKNRTVLLLERYSEGIMDLSDLENMIKDSVEGARIASSASNRLSKIRDQLKKCEAEIQDKLNHLLGSPSVRACLQEAYISVKNGRYVLPVKASCRSQIKGFVVDSSGSGSTFFIEPMAVHKLSEQKMTLQREEEDEEYQIRSWLTSEIAQKESDLRQNLEWMAVFDFISARARFSQHMGGRSVRVNTDRRIRLLQARHPLLGTEAVPLNIYLANPNRSLVITGPNTGGKTVVLKTVGLLTIMVQSGLHIPVAEGTEVAVFSRIMADVGDEQSIQQSLSTFSSHIRNISHILDQADGSSLVLLDEIGTGTDPAEGASLAAAILEELYEKGAVTLASTHYGSIKALADRHPGFANGAMTFDADTLQPLYELRMGEAGNSHAFWIASRLGIQDKVIQRAAGWLHEPENTLSSLTELDRVTQVIETPDKGPSLAEPESDQKNITEPNINIGDMVIIRATGEKGRVLGKDLNRGMLELQVKGERIRMQQKRVKLYLETEVLYPEGYDLKTVILSKEDRKLDRTMSRKLTDQVRILNNSDLEEEN